MRFCSAYLWEKGEGQKCNPVSLVLQQVEVHKHPVLFACVCRGSTGKGDNMAEAESCGGTEDGFDAVEISGYFTEALVEWFHRKGMELIEQRRPDAEVERCLQKEIGVIEEELLRYGKTKGRKIAMDCAGMLLVEQKFWMFSKGKGRIYLLNRRYNQKHIRCILGSSSSQNTEDGFWWETGILQKKLGLLLCAEAFEQTLGGKALAEALLVEGKIEEERIQKRLKEAWSMKQERREKEEMAIAPEVGVVYFMTY